MAGSLYCPKCDFAHALNMSCAVASRLRSSLRIHYGDRRKVPLAGDSTPRLPSCSGDGFVESISIFETTARGLGHFQRAYDQAKAIAAEVERQYPTAGSSSAEILPSSSEVAAVKAFDADRAWDMVVLAARAARYGE